MRIDDPSEAQLPGLRALWKEAFGDDDDFLDAFFSAAFSPDRCRCLTEDGRVAAALYWFDCRLDGRPLAYLYAVATARHFRRRGLCRRLMESTRELLRELGYAGIVLVPGEKSLVPMYARMGYRPCCGVREFSCRAAHPPVTLRAVEPREFAALRRQYLPKGGVIQEGENLDFLAATTRLYAGEDFLYVPGQELLGRADAAPGILTALGQERGTFRTPGDEKSFAMYLPLTDAPAPAYFGLAFDE